MALEESFLVIYTRISGILLPARSRSFIHDLDMQRQFKYLNTKLGAAKRSCHDCLKYGMCGNPNADYSGNYVCDEWEWRYE